MNSKTYWCKKDNNLFVIEEDAIGWYLIVYPNSNKTSSSEDYLLDTLDEAFLEAKSRFKISKELWQTGN